MKPKNGWSREVIEVQPESKYYQLNAIFGGGL
jgi:hypothetical protein